MTMHNIMLCVPNNVSIIIDIVTSHTVADLGGGGGGFLGFHGTPLLAGSCTNAPITVSPRLPQCGHMWG